MDIKDKVRKYLLENEMVRANDHVILGVSGGADSLCLLFLLWQISREICPMTLHVLHVHHGIRGESADCDAAFVEHFCKDIGVECTVIRSNIPEIAAVTHESLEEAGRRIRYESFAGMSKKLMSEGRSALVAVAHHRDDQAETVLHNIFRGSSLHGIVGMKSVDEYAADNISVKLIRPLLCLSRCEIEKYLEDNKLSYCIDETNLQREYTRNRIRHDIIPAALQINAQATAHISALSEDMGELESYIEAKSEELYREYTEETDGLLRLSTALFLKEKPFIVKEVIRLCIRNRTNRLKDITGEHIKSVMRLCQESQSGRRIELPYELKVTKCYDYLEFSLGNDMAHLIDSGEITTKRFSAAPGEALLGMPKDNYTKWFDYDKINGSLVCRNRRQGDYIVTGAGSQKLQDFFTKQKVPARERDQVKLLVIEDTGEVIWAVGAGVSRINEKYKLDENTVNVLEARLYPKA